MTSHPSPQPPESAPSRRRRWPWIAGMLLIVIGAFLAWNSFTLRRAETQLYAAGFMVSSNPSLMDEIHVGPGLLLRPGTWGNPKNWRGKKLVMQIDAYSKNSSRNLDAIASALRRIQPDWINFRGWHSLENLDGLNGLDRLQMLMIDDCPALQDLNGLSGITSLTTLYISRCSRLRNLDGIKGLTGLRILGLRGTNGIPAAALRELRTALPKTAIIFHDGIDIPPK